MKRSGSHWINEKITVKLFFIIIYIILSCNYIYSIENNNLPSSSITVQEWVKKNFAKGEIPPFSFIYNGENSNKFINNFEYQTKELATSEPNAKETVYIYSDINSGLVVKCFVTIFIDYPAVEWVLKFSNTSNKNSPIITKSKVIDYSFIASKDGDFILHHAKGSDGVRCDFEPLYSKLSINNNKYITPHKGRSSDKTAFPFFNIEMPGHQGIMFAVGWTGKWCADFTQKDSKSISIKSGMERMKLFLKPNEEIRTPKVCLLFWEGNDRMIGHNQFRQFILAHYSRKIDGKYAEYPLAGSFDYGDPAPCGEYECLTEEFAVALVKRYQQFNILPELFWLDAGWYAGCGWEKKNGLWWQNVGNWTVDKKRFPNGLRPIADAVHEVGAKFMVWFEPERARPGTQIDLEHPEWLLKFPEYDSRLVNLGNEEALKWTTDYISDFIEKEGIDYYRQDFNMNPMPYWERNDKPNRIGITEIKHIEGLYAFWDSLLVRFPNLLIDNCASGGRRIDLETISRSAPLWRTDYQYGEPNGYQCHTYGLNFYLPIHGTAIYQTDNYTFRSGLGATAVLNWEVTGKSGESIYDIQKIIKEYKSLRPYYYGDYYPLTETQNYTKDNVWLAYQLNRPSEKDGIVVAFRRQDAESKTIFVKLRGLNKDTVYEMFYEDYNLRIRNNGKDLMKGFNISIPAKRASLLIKYNAIEKN